MPNPTRPDYRQSTAYKRSQRLDAHGQPVFPLRQIGGGRDGREAG